MRYILRNVIVVGLMTTLTLFLVYRRHDATDIIDKPTWTWNTLNQKRIVGPRVSCMIFTTPDNWIQKGRAVRHTWSRHCYHRRFFYSCSAADFTDKCPTNLEISRENETAALNIPEGRNYLSAKSMTAFSISYRLFSNDTDWYLKADDDVYYRWEYLVSYLRRFDPNKSVYLGSVLGPTKNLPRGFNSGGAGYLLSQEAMRRLVTEGFENHDCNIGKVGNAEDVDVAECLQALDVYPIDTRDSEERLRFHSQNPLTFLRGGFGEIKHELRQFRSLYYSGVAFGGYNKNKLRMLSSEAISFHYVSPAEMLFFDFLGNKDHTRI